MKFARLITTLYALSSILITNCLAEQKPPVTFDEENEKGHGGGAEVCYADDTHTIQISTELYDFAENRDRFGDPAWDGTETKESIVSRVLTKIGITQPGLSREMTYVLSEMKKRNLIRNNESSVLRNVKDVRFLSVRKNCTYRQLVNWVDPGEVAPKSFGDLVLRDETFYKTQFNPLNQAALDLHEAAYKVYRTYMRQDYEKFGSFSVRYLIAEAFSNMPITQQLIPSYWIDELIMPFEQYMILAGVPLQSNANSRDYVFRTHCDPRDIAVNLTFEDGYKSPAHYKAYSNPRGDWSQESSPPPSEITVEGALAKGESAQLSTSLVPSPTNYVGESVYTPTEYFNPDYSLTLSVSGTQKTSHRYGTFNVKVNGCGLNASFNLGAAENSFTDMDSATTMSFVQLPLRVQEFQ